MKRARLVNNGVFDLRNSTFKLSLNGLLTRTDNPPPVMTKGTVSFTLKPPNTKLKFYFKLKGIVVRVAKDCEEMFRVAIFFIDVPVGSKAIIERYMRDCESIGGR